MYAIRYKELVKKDEGINNRLTEIPPNYRLSERESRAKAKANAAQGIREMVEIATDKVYRENHKEKHSEDAHNGWFYYVTTSPVQCDTHAFLYSCL